MHTHTHTHTLTHSHLQKSLPTDDSDLSMHSHQKLDRFAILLDLWTCESQYLEAKMKVSGQEDYIFHRCLTKDGHKQIAGFITLGHSSASMLLQY